MKTSLWRKIWDLKYPCYWSYLFEDWHKIVNKHGIRNLITTVICRFNRHPCGPIWYCYGDEPDMHCRNCGDDLC